MINLLDLVFPISVITPTPAASTAFLKQACLVVKPKAGQEGNVGSIFECVNMTEVAARTDNEEAEQMFAAGMSKVYILLADDLDLSDALDSSENEEALEFFTLLISGDFTDADIEAGEQVTTEGVKAELKVQDILFRAKEAGTDGNSITINYNTGGTSPIDADDVSVAGSAITVVIEDGVSTAEEIAMAIADKTEADALVECIVDEGDETDPQDVFGDAVALAGGVNEVTDNDGVLDVGSWEGVVGVQSQDDEFLEDQVAITDRCGFFSSVTHKAKNMCYAFGSLLGNLANWKNQQYIQMPFDDGVNELGQARSLFNERISFVANSTEFGRRLGMFAAGKRAIVAPYILKNLRIDLQSRALQWISQNQPDYTVAEASLLESTLQKDVIDGKYIAQGLIVSGSVKVSVIPGSNFTARSEIEVPQPKAMWQVESQMTETV